MQRGAPQAKGTTYTKTLWQKRAQNLPRRSASRQKVASASQKMTQGTCSDHSQEGRAEIMKRYSV